MLVNQDLHVNNLKNIKDKKGRKRLKIERRRRNLPEDIPDQEALEGRNAEMRTTTKGTESEGLRKIEETTRGMEGTEGMEGMEGTEGMEGMEEMAEDKTPEETDDAQTSVQ